MNPATGTPSTLPDGSRAPLPVEPPLRGRSLLRAWFWVVTAAETLGFAFAACVGALTADHRAVIVLPSLFVAGAFEGGALGWGQATVLRHALPGLSRSTWIAATAAAASVAYLIGLIPSTFATSTAAWPPALLAIVYAVLGTVLLATIGTAQWLMLRRRVERAWRWIISTGIAWIAGLGLFLGFTMPLWRPGQPLALTVAIGVAGGLLMAATTSAITGLALRRLLSRPECPLIAALI
jgi:hypothetical protein